MALPPRPEGCYGHTVKGKTSYHKTYRECFLTIWDEAPMRWVKRISAHAIKSSFRSKLGGRSWHLVIGIRKDTGHVQTECNVGSGPGPYLWREKPTLNWADEPREWFCRRCVAAWTKEVASVTVRIDPVILTKAQLKALIDKIPGTDQQRVELRPTAIEDRPGLIAQFSQGDRDDTQIRLLIVPGGVVEL